MVTAAVFLVFSAVSAGVALWWRDAPLAALLFTCFGLVGLGVVAFAYQLLRLNRELGDLEERVRGMAERRGVKLPPRP